MNYDDWKTSNPEWEDEVTPEPDYSDLEDQYQEREFE
jgi:hypothetical protein